MRVYEYSEAAFFTAAMLNLLSFVFEETAEKRQLALLSALIKGLSWHCDHSIVSGTAIVNYDGYGALFLPSRYAQWSCTTPTMLFTLSKISDLTGWQVAGTVVADMGMVLTGYLAAEFPPGVMSALMLIASYVCFGYVMYMLRRMVASAAREADSNHARMCLSFTYLSSLLIWNLFPVAWIIGRLRPYSIAAAAEPLLIFCNFSAKVVFSSCILYNNFVTLQQRRLQAQLAQEHRDRIRMVSELKESVQMKDEFISVIGHELRTPLNAIIQLSNAVARGAGGALHPTGQSWMQTITGSATHLMGIINDIITLRVVRSGMSVSQELVDVSGAVDLVVRTLTPMAKRGVVLEKVVSERMPPIVADRRRLVQVLSNLVSNALKFTEQGKVSVRVYPDSLGISIIMKVCDTGCGIAKDKIADLFKPFHQADMSKKRKYGGTGLGLSIAKQLVEMHGGTISVDSNSGVGSTFTVKLPVLAGEVRASLEAPFKKAYAEAGYSPNMLLDEATCKAAGRRSAVFRRSLDDPRRFGSAPQSKNNSIDMSQAVVEQYRWAGSEEEEGLTGISAAGADSSGPPGLAVALISDLYSSTGGPSAESADPVNDGPVVPNPALFTRTSSHNSSMPLPGTPLHHLYVAHGPSPLGTPKASLTQPNNAAAAAQAAFGPALTSCASAGRDMQLAALPPGAPHSDRSTPAGAGERVSPGSSSDAHGAVQVTTVVGQAVPVKKAGGEEEEDENDYYAGSWHKPDAWSDGHDPSAYYRYENRMSYEYRPSMDFGHGGKLEGPPQQQLGVGSFSAGVSPTRDSPTVSVGNSAMDTAGWSSTGRGSMAGFGGSFSVTVNNAVRSLRRSIDSRLHRHPSGHKHHQE